ncbi:MAG TPA: hypothetical protein VK501_22925 [Baekduia sp.]|uniref:hypothetical protein n=1 Tax=Baekduia sp. TaxID=2600305 RepID=UPI002CA72238|nr:hypothetical protein [Baekduia sp.]HMJ36776.1 hypothetical protein [Baekduia sp.]
MQTPKRTSGAPKNSPRKQRWGIDAVKKPAQESLVEPAAELGSTSCDAAGVEREDNRHRCDAHQPVVPIIGPASHRQLATVTRPNNIVGPYT